MLKSTTNADCPYFCYSENLILLLGFHKSRAAHGKVIIIKLVHKHGYSSFVICCDTLYSYFENLSIAFVKVFYENAAEILLPAAHVYFASNSTLYFVFV